MADETAVVEEERPEEAAEARAFPEPEERPVPPEDETTGAGREWVKRALVVLGTLVAGLAVLGVGLVMWGFYDSLTGRLSGVESRLDVLEADMPAKADTGQVENIVRYADAIHSRLVETEKSVGRLEKVVDSKADAEGVNRLGSSVFTLRKRVDALPAEVAAIAKKVAAEAAADSAAHAAARKRLGLAAVPAARAVSAPDSLLAVTTGVVEGHDRRLSALEGSMNRLEGLPHLQKLLREREEGVKKAQLKAEKKAREQADRAAREAEKAKKKAAREAARLGR